MASADVKGGYSTGFYLRVYFYPPYGNTAKTDAQDSTEIQSNVLTTSTYRDTPYSGSFAVPGPNLPNGGCGTTESPKPCTRARLAVYNWLGTGGTMIFDNAKITSRDYTGRVNVADISSGTFASNTGGGDFTFPSNLNVTGTVSAAQFSGPIVSGYIGANNVTAGQFGSSQGGGNYSFPAKLSVGNTNTSYALDVTGDINFTGILRQSGAPYVSSQWTTNGTSIYYNTGNVGIGTTGPLAKLHVAGECVIGKTLLPIKRRKKKRKGENDDEEWEDLLVPIKDIQDGDLVASLDEQTGKIVYRKIKKLLNKGFQKVVKITTVDGRSIETTLNHPYLTLQNSYLGLEASSLAFPRSKSAGQAISEKAKWLKVSQIKAGMRIAVPERKTRETAYAFIDASNLMYAAKKVGWKMDYEKLASYLKYRFEITNLIYVAGVDEKDKKQLGFYRKLKEFGYDLKLVPLKVFNGQKKVDVDSRLTVEAMKHMKNYKRAVFITGDGDYYWLFEQLLSQKKDIKLLSFHHNTAKELKSLFGSNFTDLGRDKDMLVLDHKKAVDAFVGSTAGIMSVYYQKSPDLSSGKIKFVEIAAIKETGRKEVFDIEVEGTHNFVGNDIIAHNTYIRGADQLNTSFSIRTADSTAADKFVVTNAGNVGIGTTGPNNKLTVSGNADITGFLGIGGIASNGYPLITYQAGSGAVYQQIVNDTTGVTTADGFLYGIDASENVVIRNLEATNMYFQTSGANRVAIDSTGNVGIGTTGPTAKLDVVGTINSSSSISGTSFYGSNELYARNGGSTMVKIGYIGSGVAGLEFGSAGDTNLYRSAANVLQTDDGLNITGNVGIGTTTPGVSLDVLSSGATMARVRSSDPAQNAGFRTSWTDGTSSVFEFLYHPNSAVAYIQTSYSPTVSTAYGDIVFRSDAYGTPRELMRLANYTRNLTMATSGGNVGIGTTGPGIGGGNGKYLTISQLNTTASQKAIIELEAGDSTATTQPGPEYAAIRFLERWGGSRYEAKISALTVGGLNNTDLGFTVSGGEAMRIQSSGNVGIGTTGPLAKLHVEGQCVTGDTLLRRKRRRRRADGTWEEYWEDVRIDQIQEGDEIQTLNEETGELVVSKIKALMNMGRKEIYTLTTVTGKTIRTTANHPYLVAPEIKPPRLAIFVDAANLEMSAKLLHLTFDYKNIMKAFPGGRLRYYSVDFATIGQRKFMGYLSSLGVKIITKPLKVITQRHGSNKHKANFDVEIASDAILEKDNYDTIVLFSGDSDFTYTANKLKNLGKKVVVVAPWRTTGRELRNAASLYLDLYRMPFVNHEKRPLRASQSRFINGKNMLTQISPLVNGGRWTKVSELKKGQMIATVGAGGKAVYEQIAEIKQTPAEQVYDIEVENTHNFVGNDIVAHNTYISGNTGIGTTGPTQKLDVSGNANVTGTVFQRGGDTGCQLRPQIHRHLHHRQLPHLRHRHQRRHRDDGAGGEVGC